MNLSQQRLERSMERTRAEHKESQERYEELIKSTQERQEQLIESLKARFEESTVLYVRAGAEHKERQEIYEEQTRSKQQKQDELIASLDARLKVVEDNQKSLLLFQDRICNGETINAVFNAFSFTSTSRASKTEIYRRMVRQSPLILSWARERNPGLTEQRLTDMLTCLDPSHENPWLSQRNQAAHCVTIAEARAGAKRAGKEGALLTEWIDLLTKYESDQGKYLHHVAFHNKIPYASDSSFPPITDLQSYL